MTLLVHIAFALLLLVPVRAAEPLTRIADVRRLPASEVEKALPVLVRGIVLNRDTENSSIYFWDGEDAIYTTGPSLRELDVRPGDELIVEGVTAGPGYAPNFRAERVQRVGRQPLPTPPRVTPAELLSDRYDCHYVETAGSVRTVRRWTTTSTDRRWVLVVAAEGVRVNVVTPPCSVAEASKFLGAKVVLRGVGAHGFDSAKRLVNAQLRLNSLEDIRIMGSLPDDEDAPLIAPGAVLRFRQGGEFGGRVRVRGSVICVRPGEWVQLQDGGDGLRVSSTQDPAPAVGDFVEALGFPEPSILGPVLEDALFSKLGLGELPTPVDTDVKGALRQHGRLVRLAGTLVEKQSDGDGQRLILRADGVLFVAALPREQSNSWMAFDPGCQLSLTGLCQVNVGHDSFTAGYPQVRGFFLHLRGPGDAALLTAAPWWTPHRLTLALSGLGAVLAFVVLWTLSVGRKNSLLQRAERELLEARDALARRVDARTDQLHEQIRARLEQRAAFTAVAAERTRMARELHDSLQQRLASAALRLEVLRRTPPEDGPSAELESLTKLMRDGQDEVRRSVWDLRALALDKHSLAEAVRESLLLLLEGTGVRGEVSIEGEVRELPAAAENHLLRIVQEAVANVLSHARAAELHITLAFEPTAVRLWIEDDGIGFTPPPPGAGDTGHYGLTDIRERARALGGTVIFESAADLGTTVRVVAPL